MINIRDYDFVQKIKSGEMKFKYSLKGLTKEFGCTPNNRETCYKFGRQACCINHRKKHHTKYHPDEIKILPEEVKKFVADNGDVEFEKKGENKGHCKLIAFCKDNPSVKPLICTLAPLGFNAQGKLVMKRMAWTRPCPYYKKGGQPAYEAMKDCLIQVFGEGIYYKMVKEIEKYNI